MSMPSRKSSSKSLERKLDLAVRGGERAKKSAGYRAVLDRQAYLETVKLLLQQGANPTKCLQIGVDDEGIPPNSGPWTNALIFAAANSDDECVKLLLSSPLANVSVVDSDGDTALTAAARNGNGPSVQALIQAGADVNYQDEEGHNPLMLALLHENLPACMFLGPLTNLGARARGGSQPTVIEMAMGKLDSTAAQFIVSLDEAKALAAECPIAGLLPPQTSRKSL